MGGKLLYQTYFSCKYCQKIYKKPKEFVRHKLKAHEFEMDRDYGAKIKDHSFFKLANLRLNSGEKTGSVVSFESQDEKPRRGSVPLKRKYVFSNRSRKGNKNRNLYKTAGKVRRSARASFSTEACEDVTVKREPQEEASVSGDTMETEFQASSLEYPDPGTVNASCPIKCKYCPKEFASELGASLHESIHTGEKPYKCGDCGKGFVYSYTRSRHKKICRGKRLKCKNCHKMYARNDHCSTHYLTCIMKSSRSRVQEKIQKKGMYHERSLYSDMMVYHEEVQKTAEEYITKVEISGSVRFRCEFCRKISSDKRNAICCVCSHTGDSLLSCKLCGDTFNRKQSFIHHARIHTGDRPYGCNICPTAFLTKKLRDVHQLGHEDLLKSFDCQKCGRWFKLEETKNLHESSCNK